MKISKKKNQIIMGFIAIVFLLSFNIIIIGVSAFTIANEDVSYNELESYYDGPTEGWVEDHHDTPTGRRFTVFETHGGYWADAEKSPLDDGSGEPAPIRPGDDDDMLCWAATASNMLEYTGWGYVPSMINQGTDDFFNYYQNHVTDFPSYINYGLEWWFNGSLKSPNNSWATEDVDHLGFWNTYTESDYMGFYTDTSTTLQYIHLAQAYGCAVGLHIYDSFRTVGHALTCWGVNYNESLDFSSKDRYLGVWLTDSDSHMGSNSPDDVLRYYEVEYDSVNNRYYLPNYGGGWFIKSVVYLSVFPGADRPTAVPELKSINDFWWGKFYNFDASSSSDPSNDKLKYRWDFNGDGTWDTNWINRPTATHYYGNNAPRFVKVFLEVFDGRLRDIGTMWVVTQPLPPIIIL